MSGKTVAAVGTGVAAVLAAPAVLAGAGFTAAGVAAGSIAALLQVTIIMSFFTACYSLCHKVLIIIIDIN